MFCWPGPRPTNDYPIAFPTDDDKVARRARIEAARTCENPRDRWLAKGYTVPALPGGVCA